ncbi:sigma-54 dependent transcriptional regulator [Paracoccus bogoriensis]|uniref:sigma-54-dependent transcriptional regulator n=1 Tax=Paracoccus bogoriensis TaxID=242065 RepID=UPI001C66DA5D|nr:sigma-54 dependent transcriptional regulator [Paracoccus bogoriensis]MBW7057211.1 sigma-54 dependent transcriptional regulator [Paracoccus bogoriensis]
MQGNRGRIIFIDDEAGLCEAAGDWLEASGFVVRTFTDPVAALAGLDLPGCDCVVTDLRMPGLDGQQVLDALRLRDPDLPVVLLSGHADVPVAVAAMRTGAHDFLEKPYRAEHLVEVLDNAVALRRARRQARAGGPALMSERLEARLPGSSAQVRYLRQRVRALADLPVDLMLSGEPGTGRLALARCLHDLGRRARKPFVALDAHALTGPGAEAELFGLDRGSGGAGRAGRVEQASGGTLYIASIEALPLALQARLMAVLREGEVMRSGGLTPRPVDLRLIAGTGPEPQRAVAEGRLRADLFHHLSAAALPLPPLRHRREDLAELFAACLLEAARRLGLPAPDLRAADLDRLMAHDWPGNLPELRAAAQRLLLAPEPAPLPDPAPPLPERLAAIEAAMIASALAEAGGVAAQAAERLGLPRRTLNEKIARYGLRDD